MTYSFTQISSYLRCPRMYRYRYLDVWREKDTRASMVFGRCFERALSAYFSGEDSTEVLFKEWDQHRTAPFEYGARETWDKLYHQGVHLLERFAQDDRVRILRPQQNLQIRLTRLLPFGGEFVSYVDAVGEIDGRRYLIDWKVTGSCYPEEPEGLLSLDPQLICYSWVSGIRDVALVVFVRKQAPEIQYLKTTITEESCKEFGQLVESTVKQIESGQFPPHSGFRFPMNSCTSCPQIGLCLGNQAVIAAKLVRRPGAEDIDWLDQLED